MSDTVQAWDVAGTEFIGGRRDPNETYRVKRYDFKRPDKFSLEQIRTVEIIHETITRRLEAVVTTRTGRRADVSIHTVDQLNFAEFLASIPDRSAFAVVELPPLLGSMLLQIDGSLAALLANAALGQSPQTLSLAAPARTFTELDAITLHSVVDEFIPAVRDGWRNAIEISPAIAAIETEARHAQIVPPTEMIILGSCRVGIEGEGAFINFAIPYLTIEPIIDRLSPKYWYSKVRSVPGSGLFGERTHDLPVDCELSVPAGRVALSSLPLILDGEPLPLPSLRKQTVDLRAGGVTVAR
ncbi:MAG: flagellar motor switch protein FliM, partial [bacterium]